ncbi:MAG: MBOAT family protein [Clostridia bacterium]|nr:MBOAT family protein [Clostridia bacterium]
MPYLSLRFLLFTAVSLAAYYALPKKWKPAILLLASLTYYTLCSRFLVIPIVCLTAVIWGAGRMTGKWNDAFEAQKKELTKEERKARKQRLKTHKRILLAAECVVGFGMLIAFKYLGFLAQIVNGALSLFSSASVPVPAFLLPLGISYYTLSMIGYAADVYYGKISPEKNFFRLLLFAVYFPHIVEGPIAAYKSFSAQLSQPKAMTYDRFMRAGERILLGLMKKMLLADRAGMIADVVFGDPGTYRSVAAALAIGMYAVQLYMDFSGCIDLVCGVSELFGIDLEQNFRRPFFSQSIQEFWRRWHITLGAWIKNYIFFPLSLSGWNGRLSAKAGKLQNAYYRSTVPMLLPLLFVWLFMGIWHGASWKYVLYGLYYYVLILLGLLLEPAFVRFCDALHIDRKSRGWRVFRMLRMTVLVLIGLTLFRAQTATQAAEILGSVFRVDGVYDLFSLKNACSLSIQDYLLLVLGCAAMAWLSLREERGFSLFDALEKRPVLRWAFCTSAVLLLILFGVYGTAYTAQPFVYAQF